MLAVPLHRKSALCWDQQRLGKSIDRKYPPALLKWNHAVSDGCGRQTARRRCLDRVRASARCRNGWGPGGSNPKVAQSCWHVYVVDLVRLEMGPSVYGGTGRLPLLSSFLANHLRSQETRYILSAFLTIPLKVNQSQKLLSRFFKSGIIKNWYYRPAPGKPRTLVGDRKSLSIAIPSLVLTFTVFTWVSGLG